MYFSKDCKNIHIKDDKLLCNYVARRPVNKFKIQIVMIALYVDRGLHN